MLIIKNILVPTDFGEAAQTALMYGRALARQFGATLHVLHVSANLAATTGGVPEAVTDFGTLQAELDAAAENDLAALVTEDDRALHVKTERLTSMNPEGEVLRYADTHDVNLIIIGTHGRGGLAHLVIGSMAEHVVRLARCPVLTVKHPEREFVQADAMSRFQVQSRRLTDQSKESHETR